MKTNSQYAILILISVSLTAILGYLGIIWGSYLLKYLSVGFQILGLILTIWTLFKLKRDINWKVIVPIISILSIYPIIRIGFECASNYQTNSWAEGIILNGGYYQLILSGTALAVLTRKDTLFNVLNSYYYFAVPVGILLFFITFFYSGIYTVGLGHILITNCIIPMSLLAFNYVRRSDLLIGWTSIILLLFVSSMISSRSYSGIAILISFLALYYFYRIRKLNLIIYLFVIAFLLFLFGSFSFFNEGSLTQEMTILQKYQFDSLFTEIGNFLKTGNIVDLFYWEGNSRAIVLIDAFSEFSIYNWLLGVGIFTTYFSFVERYTIEMGWAQEVYRWGITYVAFMFLIIARSRKFYKRCDLNYPAFWMLSSLILIKTIDGFIYGMPEISIYNLIFFWALSNQSVLANNCRDDEKVV